MEECARYGVWRLHRRAAAMVRATLASAGAGQVLNSVDELLLALAWGYGHGAVHALFEFGSLLPLTSAHGARARPLPIPPRCPSHAYSACGHTLLCLRRIATCAPPSFIPYPPPRRQLPC